MASLTSPILVLIVSIFVYGAHSSCNDPGVLCVDSISPKYGSIAGGTRLTIAGTGFLPRSLLEYNENRVVLRATTNTESFEYGCEVHKDGCMETQVMCYTEPLNDEETLQYTVHIHSASGTELGASFMCGGNLNDCSFSTRSDATPDIQMIRDIFLPPQTAIHFEGYFFTSVYASNEHAESTADNPIITRVWLSHSSLCELRANDGTDENFLLSVDEETHYGSAECVARGTYVGVQNLTFIVRQDAETGYGRSRKTPESKYVMHNNKIGMLQTYAVVDGVSPSNCGSNGGCELTIIGQFFDDTDSEPRVEVGGVDCVSPSSRHGDRAAINADGSEITCDVPARPPTVVKAGNRGVVWQRWETSDLGTASLPDESTSFEDNAEYVPKFSSSRIFNSTSGPWETGRLAALWEVPQDNRYRFTMNTEGTSDAEFYFYEVGTARTQQGSEWLDEIHTLSAGDRYVIELCYKEAPDRGEEAAVNVSVSVHMYETPYNASQTVDAINEKFRIATTSTPVPEIQKIEFGLNWAENINYESATQRFILERVSASNLDPSACQFRLGINNVFSDYISLTDDVEAVKSELLKIPEMFNSVGVRNERLEGTSVTPLAETFTDYRVRYDFVFGSMGTYGNFPLVQMVQDDNTACRLTWTHEQDTAGSARGTYITPKYGDKKGTPIKFDGTENIANRLKASLEAIFNVDCPDDSILPKQHSDFEIESDTNFYGTITNEVMPFCGFYSAKNPNFLYNGNWETDENGENGRWRNSIPSSTPVVCFAYRGDPVDSIQVRHTESLVVGGSYSSISLSLPYSSEFTFKCIDLDQYLGASLNPHIVHIRIWNYRREIGYDLAITENNLFVDTVMFLQTEDNLPSDYLNVLDPKQSAALGGVNRAWSLRNKLGSGDWVADSISVEQQTPGNNYAYSVTISTIECAYPVNLLTFDGIGDGLGYYPEENTISVTRVQSATPPVSGYFSLQFSGDSHTTRISANIAADADEEAMKTILESLNPTMGEVSTRRTGSCHSYRWDAEFTSKGGDMPDVSVRAMSLQPTDADVTATVRENGGIFWNPLRSDQLRTLHDSNQVSLRINDVMSSCDAGLCDFSWHDNNPIATSVTPTQGAAGASVNVQGSGFSATQADNSVRLGGVACVITHATSTSLTCTVGQGAGTDREIDVLVRGNGLATHDGGPFVFTYLEGVSDMLPTPRSGSTAGGYRATITGSAFSDDTSVSFGSHGESEQCSITSVTYSEIICEMPAHAAGPVDIRVGSAAQTFSFDYVTPSASVTSVTPSNVNVDGSTYITISGSGFPTENVEVYVGEVLSTDVSSSTATEIVARAPQQTQGDYDVRVRIADSGYASGDHTVTYAFEVTDINPRAASLLGGVELTLTGSGFSDDVNAYDVTVGDRTCYVQSVNAMGTQIVCELYSMTDIVHLRPSSSVVSTTLQVGDFVTWSWEGLTQTVVYQTDNNGNYVRDGFQYPDYSASGYLIHRFTESGTFYYSSSASRPFRGTIIVAERDDYIKDVSVSVSGIEAQYDTSASSTSAPTCGGVAGTCCDSLAFTDNSIFQMKFCDCLTPRITSVVGGAGADDMASVNRFITVTGSGFGTSSDDCEAVVFVGKNVFANNIICAVDDSTYTSTNIDCRVSDHAENDCVRTGLALDVDVWVKHRGYALPTQAAVTARQLTFRTSYTGITPSTGSSHGGQGLTVTGAGFCCGSCPDDNSRRRRRRLSGGGMIGPSSVGMGPVGSSEDCYQAIPGDCDGSASSVVPASFTYLPCRAGTITVLDDMTLECTSTGASATLPYCDASSASDCQITTGPSSTPTVTAVSPTSISQANTQITITGTLFDAVAGNNEVTIGDTPCSVVSSTTTQIVCNVGEPAVGSRDLVVTVRDLGQTASYSIEVDAVISSVSPSTIGTSGASLLTVTGLGFVDGSTTITIGSADCELQSVSGTQVVCTAPALAAGNHALEVRVASIYSYPEQTITVSEAENSVIDSINPATGRAGDTLTITGNFAPPSVGRRKRTVDIDVTVMVGDTECDVTTSSAVQISCTLAHNAAGSYDVTVTSQPGGLVTAAGAFTYLFAALSITPNAGALEGGMTVTIEGSGFVDGATSVTICGTACSVESVTDTAVLCTTGAYGAAAQCDVSVTVSGDTYDLSDAFTYSNAQVQEVFPSFGPTSGGTMVTISGEGFDAVTVMIGDVLCAVQSQTATSIVCQTGEHRIDDTPASAKYPVTVLIGGTMEAPHSESGPHTFDYAFRWSDPAIWEGGAIPGLEDFVVIPDTMGVVLDDTSSMDAGPLDILLIRGGRLYFQYGADLFLKANVIFITEGGVFQVGTESRPFEGTATIEMHGHVRSIELPIYGTKCIALRNGTLDLHGADVSHPWALLAATASPGASQITVQGEVDWWVGANIAIASTGLENSQAQNEEHTIAGISTGSGQTVITLTSPLTYGHLGTTIGLDGESMDVRAEVGLLSRNLIFRGSENADWDEEIEACPQGFDSGEFATQTCFQGRFGEEIGTDEFGAHIIMHGPEKYYMDDASTERSVTGRFSNVELTFVGQAFRLGRYAVHFHLNGDMETSYVKKCAIHKSFNRAVNIHGTNYVTIENNVAYNIMGGAFFLEDGIEQHNVFHRNVAIFVKSSTSLQNDDITPAAYWVTNANNDYTENRAAGGTHFGFWYRMHAKADASSTNEFPNANPRLYPLSVFRDNVVHSQGWFGIWIFQVWTPMRLDDTEVPQVAVFDGMDSWNNEKCAEWVGAGAIQFTRFRCVNNQLAGVEMKMMMDDTYPPYDIDNGPAVKDSVFMSYDNSGTLASNGVGNTAVVLPMSFGLYLDNLKFINYDRWDTFVYGVTRIQGTVGDKGGGFRYKARRQTFVNVNSVQKFKWEWIHEGVMEDEDGSVISSDFNDESTSVTDFSGYSILPYNGLLPVGQGGGCQRVTSMLSFDIPSAICDSSFKFRRFSFNEYDPDSLEGLYAVFSNEHGSAVSYWKDKRKTHKQGWMVMLAANAEYSFTFQNAEHLNNISYSGRFYEIEENDYIVIRHPMPQLVDHVQTVPGQEPAAVNFSAFDIADPSTGYMGSSYFDDAANDVVYLVTARNNGTIDDDGVWTAGDVEPGDKDVVVSMYQCFYSGCVPPPDSNRDPPARQRQSYVVYYSSEDVWGYYEGMSNVFVANQSEAPENDTQGTSGLPIFIEDEITFDSATDLIIMEGTWLIVDVPTLPEFRNIYIYGTLEIPYSRSDPLELVARSIHILGGRLIVGWPDDPDDSVPASQVPRRMQAEVTIVLKARPDDEEIRSATVNVGPKGIGAFGGIDLHGVPRVTMWTSLSEPANPGDNAIRVLGDVASPQGTLGQFSYRRAWAEGDEIVVATTSFQATHSEVRTIEGIEYDASDDSTRITLNEPLRHKHIAVSELINGNNGETLEMRAEVGLLTHNIKVIGATYHNIENILPGFGGRVVVARAANTINPITGESLPSAQSVTYNGFGRFSSVRFENMGQYGFTASYDARPALGFTNLGDEEMQALRPSFSVGCSFMDSYNAALGTFNSKGILLQNNVVYKTVGASVRMVGTSSGNTLESNLVIGLINPATWQDRTESTLSWTALVEINEVDPDDGDIRVVGNHVAGSERGGYRTDGYRCANSPTWTDNHAHSTLDGVFMFPFKGDGLRPCTVIDGFKVWRNYDFGIYVQNPGPKVQIKNIVSVENRVGLYPMVYGSASLLHDKTEEHIKLSDSIFKGQSSVFDCEDDITDSTFLAFSSMGRSFWRPADNDAYNGGARGGMSGIAWPTFMSGDNAGPRMPVETLMSYHSIRGKMVVTDTHFEGFGTACDRYINSVFVTPSGNEDAVHPIYLQGTTIHDVLDESKVFIFRPNVGKVNPSDCVDMDCDAKRKALLVDETGGFLGEPWSSVIPEAEWAWDVPSLISHGIGMFRVPNTLKTTVDGERIADQDIVHPSNQGIVRDPRSCENMHQWNGHLCAAGDLKYHMLQIESMDHDTETRRISPVAVLSMPLNQSFPYHNPADCYLDLVNGPQDHGWCMGYTCQLRLSLFPILLANDLKYEVHFTGTTPQHLRLHWLNTGASDKVLLGIWYAQRWRLYVNVIEMAEASGSEEALEDMESDFAPTIDDPIGTYHFDIDYQTLWVVVGGSDNDAIYQFIDITTDPNVIYVSMDIPAMTEDEFFGERIMENFATYFGIPDENIRVAEFQISSTKRDAVVRVWFEISNPSSVASANDMTAEEVAALNDAIYETYQLGLLDDVMGVEILAFGIVEPLPDTDSEHWEVYAQLDMSGAVTVQIPQSLELYMEPVVMHEGMPFPVQPVVHALDAQGERVGQLGAVFNSWNLTAELIPVNTTFPAEAELLGMLSVRFWNGTFVFSDLAVSHTGVYKIRFEVSSPDAVAGLFSCESMEFYVADRPVAMDFVDGYMNVTEGVAFNVTVQMIDAYDGEPLEDIGWRGHTWEVHVSLYDLHGNRGQLSVPVTVATVEPVNGTATFEDLVIDAYGRYFLEFRLVTDPPEFDIYEPTRSYIDVFPEGYTAPSVSAESRVRIRFRGDYDVIGEDMTVYFAAVIYNVLVDEFFGELVFTDFDVYEGSVVVAFDGQGSPNEIADFLSDFYDMVTDGITVTFNSSDFTTMDEMYVDGEEYTSEEEEKEGKEQEEGLALWAIVLIATAVGFVLVLFIAFLLYRYYFSKRWQQSTKSALVAPQKRETARRKRRGTVMMNADDSDYFYPVKATGPDPPAYSDPYADGDGNVIIPSTAPSATSFNFQEIRPTTGYRPPGRLPPIPNGIE